jgi:hypothetical protein
MASLPGWLKRLYVWYVRYIKRDELYAGLIEGWHERKVFDYWPIVAQREDYRRRWFEMWQKEGLDFVLTVPNSLPAVPHNGMKDGFKALGYTLLFNLVSTHIPSSPMISMPDILFTARLHRGCAPHHTRRCY